MAGLSSKALNFGNQDNKRKYNGIEYENSFDLNIGETFYRTHDPQIGRWWQIDPKPTEAISLYAAMENNPISLTDPLGDKVRYDREEGITNKEFRQFKREIRQMRRNSPIFKAMFKEFKKDKTNTFTYVARANNFEHGGGWTKVSGGYNLGINFRGVMGKTKQSFNRMSMVAHETGHVWRQKNNLDPNYPEFPKTPYPSTREIQLENNEKFSKYNEDFVKAKNTREGGASHIENMVLSELINSGNPIFKGLDLTEENHGGMRLTSMFVFGRVVHGKEDAALNVLEAPRDRNYYLNTKFNLYNEHGIKNPEND